MSRRQVVLKLQSLIRLTMSDTIRTAGCLCGAVRLTTQGDPFRVGICHCLDCRKHHGALFHASAIFPETAVSIAGETTEYKGRHFCPACGSSVYGRSNNEIEVSLGAFDAIDEFRPTYELWLKRRELWLPSFGISRCYQGDRDESSRSEP